ncbi:MAG: squalene synthase HpnC [Leptothrix sp. (in: b-proteobacteria)]
MSPDPPGEPMSVNHYENFPVASVLCPPALRPPIAAIYWYARTADDLADEGDAPPGDRLLDLAQYRADLHAAAAGTPGSGRWAHVFDPLAAVIAERGLPIALLTDLLDAFEQDVHQPVLPDRDAVLDYCRRSANPIGRLLLHLYAVDDDTALRQSDAICTALQLINFWQDLSLDLPRRRLYIPQDELAHQGLAPADLLGGLDRPDRAPIATQTLATLLAELTHWARIAMRNGAPLVHRLPGRVGWELRLVVQGGLAVLDQVDALGARAFFERPRLQARHAPRLLWRALRM